MKAKYFGLLASVVAFQIQCVAAQSMTSPSGQVVADLQVDEAGRLRYSVDFNGRSVVEPSALGVTVDGIDLGKGVALGAGLYSETDNTYPTRGNHTVARNHFRAWKYSVTHEASKRKYSLEFRAYDDGVAYRYIVPGSGVQHVDGERSSWKLADDSKTWFFERDSDWKLMSYAGEWIAAGIDEMPTISSEGPIQGTPLVFELPGEGGYAAITKAALYDYSGMRLEAKGDRTFQANFTEGEAGFDVEGTIVTPWRVTMLAEDLNTLVNSDLINNLNPAPDVKLFADQDYIKPGRSAWSWETLGLGTPETQKEFITLAGEMGFEYSTVDDGWKDWTDPWGTMKMLCDHGASRNVGVFLWVHSNDIDNPKNGYEEMRRYFDKVAAAGSVGLKIDFMNNESKAMVDFEIAALRLAAERKLVINFHGCHASTGEERTYPNELTREGIRGIEVNKHKSRQLPAFHNAALPFTRFILGQADYTPILYTNPGPTTWAHQVATLVNYNTALQTYAEHPDTMMNAPIIKEGFELIQTIPVLWDETIVLEGSKIGDLCVFARRLGEDWFVGVINGAGERSYDLDLSFLSKGSYAATILSDDLASEPVAVTVGVNQKADLKGITTTVPFKVESSTVNRKKSLEARLAEGGGYVVRFVKK